MLQANLLRVGYIILAVWKVTISTDPVPLYIKCDGQGSSLSPRMLTAGQFIASSPTLFPEEYVLEFEKCLDRTEPV